MPATKRKPLRYTWKATVDVTLLMEAQQAIFNDPQSGAAKGVCVMAKHTPGPWQWFTYERAGGIFLGTPDRGQLIVMDFVRQGMQAGQPRFAIWEGAERGRLGGIMKPAEILNLAEHPDACLIAAAPDTLEACQHALEVLVGTRYKAGVDVKLARAIAKATGDAIQ